MDQFAKSFYHPEVVEARLQGLPDPLCSCIGNAIYGKSVVKERGSIKTASTPPVLTVTPGEIDPETRLFTLSITAKDEIRQITDVEIIVNGRLVGGQELQELKSGSLRPENTKLVPSSADRERQFEFSIPVQLDPGLNRIEIVAANDYNYGLAQLTRSAPPAKEEQKPDLYLLAIGINEYASNPDYNLRYAVSDSNRIIASFKAQEGKRFKEVKALSIFDNEAAKKNILYNIKDFFKQAGRNDIVALFIASHGVTEDGVYYFLPSDTIFTEDENFDTKSAVSIVELIDALDIPGRKIIMLDTCHSGGVDTNRLVHNLRNRSMVIFTAAQEDQLARENGLYSGGLFTTGITEGLGGKAAENGVVMINKLKEYVSERVMRISKNRQRPVTLVPDGYTDFVISVLE